jgi:hypothetical protein
VERASAHFHVIRLQNGATLLAPISMEREDQILKTKWRNVGHGQPLAEIGG